MTPRNGKGRFVKVSEKLADSFGSQDREGGTVSVDVGRGAVVDVAVGSPLVNTLEELARNAHYGGFFRVFINGSEMVNPEDAPDNIEAGMRIAITSYDKVGGWSVH